MEQIELAELRTHTELRQLRGKETKSKGPVRQTDLPIREPIPVCALAEAVAFLISLFCGFGLLLIWRSCLILAGSFTVLALSRILEFTGRLDSLLLL